MIVFLWYFYDDIGEDKEMNIDILFSFKLLMGLLLLLNTRIQIVFGFFGRFSNDVFVKFNEIYISKISIFEISKDNYKILISSSRKN